MKKTVFMSIIIVALIAGTGYAQMMGGGMMGYQEQETAEVPQQPYPYRMGPGMMGGYGYGYGMGPGMMGGYGMGPGMMGGYGMGPGMWGGYGMGHGMMGGYGMGPCMMGGYGYGEERQKFFDETADLRKELHEKKFDYFEAIRKADTKPETVSKLEQEIRELQRKIYEKARKINP